MRLETQNWMVLFPATGHIYSRNTFSEDSFLINLHSLKVAPPLLFYCELYKLFGNSFFIEHLWSDASGSNVLGSECNTLPKGLCHISFPSEVFRSSRQRCSIKKVVLKNLGMFTGKHLCCSLFLIKLLSFKPTNLLKRDSNTRALILKNICESLVLYLTL